MTPNNKPEFTKLILRTVMIIYILSVLYGGFIVYNERSSIGEFFTFVGAPTGIAIAFYVWKAKAENLHKNPPWIKMQNKGQLNSEEVILDEPGDNDISDIVQPSSSDNG